MKKIYYILILIIAAGIISCDKVDKPYKKSSNNNTDTTEGVKRKVLVEDFTGHTCGNCPRGHRTLKDLSDIYGERLIPISIHCGYYAIPHTSGIKYRYDFRTAVGNILGGDGEFDYEGLYGIQQYPSGLVNSVKKEDICPNDAWPTLVAQFMETEPKVSVEIESFYSQSSGKATSNIKITALEKLNSTLNLVVYVVEDSIKRWQTDYDQTPNDDSTYMHRHVLRLGVNGHFGEQIVAGNFNQGSQIERSYTIQFGADWVKSKCAIVAFVFDAETKEILQAEESKKFFVIL